jgi:uncharacterized protein GlcG (DUF336 family)
VQRCSPAAEAEALKRDGQWRLRWSTHRGLILLHVLDGTQAASQEIAIAKARTAARLKRPTKALEDALTGGRMGLLSVSSQVVTLEGGVPVVRDGAIIGAIGISGMMSAQDGEIAAAALAAFG